MYTHTHTDIYICRYIYIYILVVKEWLHLIISMYKYASPKRSYRDHYREIIQTEQCVMTCNSKFTACVQVQVFRIRYMAIFDCWLRHKLMSFNPMEYQKTRLNRGRISKIYDYFKHIELKHLNFERMCNECNLIHRCKAACHGIRWCNIMTKRGTLNTNRYNRSMCWWCTVIRLHLYSFMLSFILQYN